MMLWGWAGCADGGVRRKDAVQLTWYLGHCLPTHSMRCWLSTGVLSVKARRESFLPVVIKLNTPSSLWGNSLFAFSSPSCWRIWPSVLHTYLLYLFVPFLHLFRNFLHSLCYLFYCGVHSPGSISILGCSNCKKTTKKMHFPQEIVKNSKTVVAFKCLNL